jgi:hypothetical protein
MRKETLDAKTPAMWREIMAGHELNLQDERLNCDYMMFHLAMHNDRLYCLHKTRMVGNRDTLMRQVMFGNVFHRYMVHIDHEEYVDLYEQLEVFFEHDYRMEYRIDEWQGEYILRGVYMDVYGREDDFREETHEMHLYTFAVRKEAEWIKHILELTDEKLDCINKGF